AGHIDQYMLKKQGEAFQKGEVIAENKPPMGLKFLSFMQSKVLAEFDGTVDNVSSVTGQVILRYPPRLVQLNAYVDGIVVEVRKKEGVVVETHGSFIQGIFGIGGETTGELVLAVSGPGDVLDADQIKPEHMNKIVVGGSLFTGRAFE